MKLKKFIKDENGGVMPLIAIILGLFALGFIALVVDVGTLYSKRKAEITCADSAALAGAQVLREYKVSGLPDDEAKTKALETANNYAVTNGLNTGDFNVYVGEKTVTLPNGTQDQRQVVEVSVKKNYPLIFAKFLGYENTDVNAYALATWGYDKKSSYFPMFIFNTSYDLNTSIALHENVTVLDNETSLKTSSYGFVQVGASEGMSDIRKAIEGSITVNPEKVGKVLNGAPGKRESVYSSAMTRIGDTVIVPVINWDIFKTMTENLKADGTIKSNPVDWHLPIDFYAYFKITNVIQQNVKGIDSVEIQGEFTGKVPDEEIYVEDDDQVNPNEGGDAPATYSKLIK